MVAVKGIYDGTAVLLDSAPPISKCDVIVTFLGVPDSGSSSDDGSLEFLFKNYSDDGIREQIIDFGKAVGHEQW